MGPPYYEIRWPFDKLRDRLSSVAELVEAHLATEQICHAKRSDLCQLFREASQDLSVMEQLNILHFVQDDNTGG